MSEYQAPRPEDKETRIMGLKTERWTDYIRFRCGLQEENPVAFVKSPAVEAGALTMPTCTTVPLVDDIKIGVDDGELVAQEVAEATIGRIEALCDLVGRYYDPSDSHGLFDRPTMISLPSRECVKTLTAALSLAGVPAVYISAETPHMQRQAAFRACVEREAVLLQTNVVSEGVDLPIRRLIDASPTLSPFRWLWQLGLVTRPGRDGEYVCTNRNILRHGYLLDGCLPASVMEETQAAYTPPSRKSRGRSKPR